MTHAKLPLPVVLFALCLPLSGTVLAEQSSKLMQTGELACNYLCRAWMSMGDTHEVVGAAAQSEPSPSPTVRLGAPRDAGVASRAPKRAGARLASARHAHVATAKQTAPGRAQVTARSGPAVPMEHRSGVTIAGAPMTSPPAPRVPLTEAQNPSVEPVLFEIASRHRPVHPVPSADRSPPDSEADALPLTEATDPPTTVAGLETHPQQALRISPDAAEVLTGTFAATVLILMSGLPLTSRPRRRGNPSLMATLRAERRAEAARTKLSHGEPVAALKIAQPRGRLSGFPLRHRLATRVSANPVLAVPSPHWSASA